MSAEEASANYAGKDFDEWSTAGDVAVPLVDIASSLHMQIAIALQVAALTVAGKALSQQSGRPMYSMANLLHMGLARHKDEVESVIRICYNALTNVDMQYACIAHLDRDELHLALNCLLDYIEPRNDSAVRERQPWRFFLARIGVIAKHSDLSIKEKNAKLERIGIATESILDYITYLYKEIDIELAKYEPDLARMQALEEQADRMQNSTYRPYRLWRQCK